MQSLSTLALHEPPQLAMGIGPVALARKLMGMPAKTACVIRHQQGVDIPVQEVEIGDRVVVRSGDNRRTAEAIAAQLCRSHAWATALHVVLVGLFPRRPDRGFLYVSL